MKYVTSILLLIIAIASCDSTKSSMQEGTDNGVAQEGDTIRIANDSLEYEIIIIEPGFNSWLVTQFPEDYYGIAFLENKNIFYVNEYNRRVLNGQYSKELYPQLINYEANVHYGKEVNYLLYNYFQYFEEKYNQRLR
ncbi:DUF6146 family protein [Altibacter sp. HG106]|uniref:DUF6146 family protein n=1 Tax=Altibacter sp. HG106 TaxID=3023937 RepID=UPI0023504183|nr:DUF6146 family protein [Altibacter sp. HG106]MDC7993643.1 DUF6146 family protein [Altibacter sp. HG106]